MARTQRGHPGALRDRIFWATAVDIACRAGRQAVRAAEPQPVIVQPCRVHGLRKRRAPGLRSLGIASNAAASALSVALCTIASAQSLRRDPVVTGGLARRGPQDRGIP